jgi:hypothetical protein
MYVENCDFVEKVLPYSFYLGMIAEPVFEMCFWMMDEIHTLNGIKCDLHADQPLICDSQTFHIVAVKITPVLR